jgi:hypothetical protein
MGVDDDARRVAQTQIALRRLATGGEFARGELFDKRNGKYESWINRVLNRLIEWGIVETTGADNWRRKYKLASATVKGELLAQAGDPEKISALIWPHQEPEPPPLAPEPEDDHIEEDTGTNGEAAPPLQDAVLLLVQLMGGVIDKLDRIERGVLECQQVLKEFTE